MSKLLIVTGGTKGIGLALIRKFANEDLETVTCSRSKEGLDRLAENFKREFPRHILHCREADLSERKGTESFIEFIRSLGKPVEVLVNNAGLFFPGQVHDEPEGNLEMLMQLNVISPYHLVRAVVNGMISRGKGHIFNICSTASITAYTNGGAYSISKFALYGMTKILREELKSTGVRVTAVLPGATYTDSWKGTELPQERFMKAEDVASTIYNAWKLSDNSVVEEIILRPRLGDIQ